MDGVSECKSNSNSLDVYSVRFSKCRTVYPIQILRPIGKYCMDHKTFLDNFLTDLCINRCHIHSFIGDNPKRAFARDAKSHSSYYPCEYCEAQGQLLFNQDVSFQERKNNLQRQKNTVLLKLTEARDNNEEEEIESLQLVLQSINDAIKLLKRKNNNIVWPSSTRNGIPRTTEGITEITDKLDNGEVLSLDEAKGITGRSLFLDIPYFVITRDIPTEYLHTVCLGVGKKLIELTFNVGEKRKTNTTRKLSSVEKFNNLMSLIQVVREFSRRARSLDFAVMKGQEYRNIIIIFFPIVVDCVEKTSPKLRRVWLLLAYMIRLCIIPNQEYDNADSTILETLATEFYQLYEEIFHPRNCTYNTHTVGSHLPNMRAHGPLTLTSAFGFEAFYGEMRHAFTPGTASPLKQIMSKILLKRKIAPHCCRPSIFYSTNETGMESNCFIYTFSADNGYSFFKIISIEDDSFECVKVHKHEAAFQNAPELNWGNIGVFSAGNVGEEKMTIQRENVAGKVIKVTNFYITCPINVLEEK